MKNLKIGDILIYILLGLFALVGFIGMKSMATMGGRRTVVVLLDGREIERVPISSNMEAREIYIDAGYGNYNILNITDEGAKIVKASCSDGLCMRQGRIDNPGQSIVCLPNKVVVKILGEEGDSQ